MSPNPDYLRVQFGQDVWHDEPYDENPADFFDRREAKEKALAILHSPETRRAVWLIGERRAGKTSMLRLLLEKCRAQAGFVAIEVPWQSIHSSIDFYRELLSNLDRGIGKTDSNTSFVTDSTTFWEIFRERREKTGKSILVVGIDELDSVFLEKVDENSRKEILASIMRLVTEETKTKVILTTALPSHKVEYLKASPLVSRSEEIKLWHFYESDIDELVIVLGSNLSDIERKQICTLSGGWPYYAKAILYHLLQLPEGDFQRLERARIEAVKSIAQTCEHLYRHHWDDNERLALLLLVNKGGLSQEEFSHLDVALRTALRELTDRSYVLEESMQYLFRVKLIDDWFQGWTRRELEEERLGISQLLKQLERGTDPWHKEDGEISIQVTKEELRRRGF